jgi:CubicO group peptidase (beta-lactamase class C family)
LLALLTILQLTAQASPTDSLARDRVVGPLGRKIDSALTRMSDYGLSGTVLVVRGRRIVLLKGYGMAIEERRVKNSAATRFEMNSMAKMFTGVSILQLSAVGRLRLTDSVSKFLGPFDKGDATIAQLASHTAGLIVAGTNLSGESREAFVSDVKTTPREAPAGTQYRYTNAGYSLLAAIIETITGGRYESYLRANIFLPAGMSSAVFRDSVSDKDTLFAHGYVGTPAGLEPGPPNPYVWGTRGAGGVWCTVGDMYRYLVAVASPPGPPSLRSGQALSANAERGNELGLREAQRRILFSPPQPPSQEAFGWHVNPRSDTSRARIDKGGGSPDFASQLLYYPEDGVVIIWASNNLRQRWRRTLNQVLPDMVFGRRSALLPAVRPYPTDKLISHVGKYRAGNDTLELRAGPGYLYAVSNKLTVPTDVIFLPQGQGRFTGFDPATGTVTRLEVAAATVTIVLSNGRRITARKP